jgi:outer membrane receptor protein involved in Fe transport
MLKKLFFLSIFLLIVPSLLFGGVTGKIAGKVKDKDNGEPIVGASVLLQGTSFGAAVDVSGEFFILNVPPGTYTLKASAIGYGGVSVKNVEVSADATTKIDVVMSQSAVQVQEVVVQAERPLVERSTTSTIRRSSSEEISAIPRENVQGIVALSAGVVNGANFRGGRSTENIVQVDGLTVSDPQNGGMGGDTQGDPLVARYRYYPTVSNLAVEEVQVMTGGFTAEYGNALSGVINTITKEGSSDRYEGIFRTKFDAPGLNGKSDQGYKLNGLNEQLYEFSFGGPLLGLWKSRFFLSGKHNYQQYRQASYAFIDPAGNNIGQLPHNRFVNRDLNAKFTLNPTDKIKVTISGFAGASMWETSQWSWFYAGNFGANSGTNDYLQQPNFVLSNKQAFARITHTLSNATFYELTLSYFSQDYHSGKKDELAKFNSLFDTFDIYGFTDDYTLKGPNTDSLVAGTDGIMDRYAGAGQSGYGINPLTGRREGSVFTAGTQNPYGVYAAAGNVIQFTEFGNDRTFRFQTASYSSLNGSVTSQVNKYNLVKAGFDVKLNRVFSQYNSLPWDANPFADNYDYKPRQASLYVQDKIEYQGIVINPGLRVDYLDPQAKKIADLLNPGNPPKTTKATAKTQVSPRFGIAFPLTERSKFFLNYGWYFQEPVLTRLYESITKLDLSRGNQLFGNPDLDPQRTKAFEFGYAHQFTDVFALDVTAYYKDLYNIEGVTFVPAVPSSFTLYSVSEYGNVRGVELTLTKRLEHYWRAKMSYAYSVAKGTASNVQTNYQLVTNGPPDPYLGGSKVYPLTDYYLDFDRRHVINLILDFVVGSNEGPTVGGVHFLQNISMNLTTAYQTGTPYTRIDYRGFQVGEYNGARRPAFTQTDLRINRDIPLSALFGSGVGKLELTIYADVQNLFNRVEANDVYAVTGVADNDGFVVSNPSTTLWVKGDPKSVDAAGFPLYNKYIDLNNDGVNDQSEKLYGINKLRQDFFNSRLANYQLARRVWFGVMVKF